MKRTRRQYFTGLVTGVLLAVLISNLAAPALALVRDHIEIYSGINVYVDDVKIDPKDANGKSVPVFSYNGTTYLPVRALSNALGRSVQWDAAASSVYVGKHTGSSPALLLRDMDYFYRDGGGFISESMTDNLGVDHDNVLSAKDTELGFITHVHPENTSQTYLLNGQYTALSGTLFQNYDQRSDTNTNTLKIYGDGELLYQGSVSAGVPPQDFKIDVTGVLQLTVAMSFYSADNPFAGVADLGLWT